MIDFILRKQDHRCRKFTFFYDVKTFYYSDHNWYQIYFTIKYGISVISVSFRLAIGIVYVGIYIKRWNLWVLYLQKIICLINLAEFYRDLYVYTGILYFHTIILVYLEILCYFKNLQFLKNLCIFIFPQWIYSIQYY